MELPEAIDAPGSNFRGGLRNTAGRERRRGYTNGFRRDRADRRRLSRIGSASAGIRWCILGIQTSA